VLRRSLAALSTLGLALSITLIGSSTAHADYVYTDPLTGQTYLVVDTPPTDPTPGSGSSSGGLTPGAAQCAHYQNVDGERLLVELPCTDGDSYWSNERRCYVSLASADVQASREPPAGSSATGAYYDCYNPDILVGTRTVTFWSDTPPPGIIQFTPGQAAQQLIESFLLRGIDIGFAPDPTLPNSRGHVGIPIWMWVNDPQPLTYGPYTETATLGGVTITATAEISAIVWNMGDGTTVTCANAGTPYQVSFGVVDSPNCGHRYSRMSNTQPGGRYTVTATSLWDVDWTGGGETGTIPLERASNTTVEVRDLQALNVG
jgi:hypothetical protein